MARVVFAACVAALMVGAATALAPAGMSDMTGVGRIVLGTGAVTDETSTLKLNDDGTFASKLSTAQLTGTYTFYDFATNEVAAADTPPTSGFLYIEYDSNFLSLVNAAGNYATVNSTFLYDFVTNTANKFSHVGDFSFTHSDVGRGTMAMQSNVATCAQFDLATQGWDDLPVGEYRFVRTGGNTKCADGSEYGFLVRKGAAASDKVVFDFAGGGACWDVATCSRANNWALNAGVTALDCTAGDTIFDGIHRSDAADNPVRDWTHVYVPYCTQDVHVGSTAFDFGGGLVAQFNGAVNAKAVLSTVLGWVEPSDVLMTGCSAGGYGAIAYAPYVATRLPKARMTVFTDSSVGVLAANFSRAAFGRWNGGCALAKEVLAEVQPGREAFYDEFMMAQMWVATANAFPDMRLALYTSKLDTVQMEYFSDMYLVGQLARAGAEYAPRSAAMVEGLVERIPRLGVYVVDGDTHCMLTGSDAWQQNVNGVAFPDWLSSVLAGDEPAPVVCDTCASADIQTCDGQMGGDLLDECGVCGGDNTACQLQPLTNFPPTCQLDLTDLYNVDGTCTAELLPQSVWVDGAVFDSYCRGSLHVCCDDACASDDNTKTLDGVKFFKRTEAGMEGMKRADCPTRVST